MHSINLINPSDSDTTYSKITILAIPSFFVFLEHAKIRIELRITEIHDEKKKNLYFPRAKLDAYSTYFQYKFTYEIPDARYRNYNTEILPEDNLVYWEKKEEESFQKKRSSS